MKTSASGRALIEQREGRRLSAYRDSRGIWTIGVGHAATGLPPRPCAGMTITEAECDALLAADLAPVEVVIATAVTVPVSQNEFDALASLGFNIGVGGLRKSTVVRQLNLGDINGAADAFMNWCKPAVLASRSGPLSTRRNRRRSPWAAASRSRPVRLPRRPRRQPARRIRPGSSAASSPLAHCSMA